VSYPCGSEGASSDAENERYIVITLANAANNTGRDFCANRVTEDDFKDLNITLCSTLPTVTNTASSTGGYLENYMKKNKKNNNIANNSNFTFTNYAPNSVCNMLNDLNYINPQISFPFSINSLGSGELDLGETFDPKELMELQQLGASFQIDPKCVDPMCSSDCITRAQNIVDRVNKLLDNNKQEIVSGECVKAVKNKMDELDRSIGTQNSVNLGLNGRDFNNGTLRPGVSIPLHK